MKWSRIFFQPNLPLGENGKRLTACDEHIALSKEAATEGMVLLKNNNSALPLQSGSKIALFGKATIDYVKGGGGSGDVTVAYTRNFYEGLKLQDAGFEIFKPLCEFYETNVKEQYANKVAPGMTKEPKIPEKLLKEAKVFTNTAIISICRFSGEGWDRKDDFYLTKEERKMVKSVTSNFEKVIVVLNVGGMVDTTWFKNNDKIQAVLLAWQGGMEGGLAAADIISGKSTPSGKLTDTFASAFEDYPSTESFTESEDYVNYTEDIYVGYRYFETIPDAKKKVNYCFGFGLSYTSFDIKISDVKCDKKKIVILVNVTNTGDVSGKEVVQIYYGAPDGVLGKPKKALIAFKKTRELLPGECQTLTLSFNIADMASYDDLGKIAKSAYVMEKGDYKIYAGNSVEDADHVIYTYTLKKDVITKQLSKKCAPAMLEKRMLSDGTYEKLKTKKPNDFRATKLKKPTPDEVNCFAPAVKYHKPYLFFKRYADDTILLSHVAEGKHTIDEFIRQLTDEELAELLGGQPNTSVANTFGFGNLPEYGVPNVMTADGPAGLRIWPEVGVCTTAFPCATQMACTWNVELIERIGAAAGSEVKENNIGVWLAPALNIHRNPMCGRNFEYYSEDPFLAGKIGAAMVNGIQSNRIGACIKHFCCNNKETNRMESDSRVSERALREIYLKGFEIIVKEAAPWCVMTAYNVLNEHRTSENKELITDILRGEWGYDGLVTSDWWTSGEHYKELEAGNDIKMGCGYPERLMQALKKGLISRKTMETSVKRLFDLMMKLD